MSQPIFTVAFDSNNALEGTIVDDEGKPVFPLKSITIVIEYDKLTTATFEYNDGRKVETTLLKDGARLEFKAIGVAR